MRKIISLLVGLLLCSACFADTLPLMGVGSGGGVAAYTGPLDCSGCASSANIVGLWSLRCASASYTGNVADVWDSSTGSTTETLITCSSGGVLNETINSLATTCASGCNIKTLYDQSGALKCVGGTACDLTKVANANRPTFTTSCLNSKYCGVCPGTAGVTLNNSSGLASSVAQTFMLSYVGEQTANFTSNGTLFGADDQTVQVGFGNVTNSVFLYSGGATAPTATASNNAFHAVQTTVAGGSSEIYVDGTGTPAGTAGTNSFAATVQLDLCEISTGNANPLTGKFTEVSLWSGGAWTSGQKSSMNSNQHSYWGF